MFWQYFTSRSPEDLEMKFCPTIRGIGNGNTRVGNPNLCYVCILIVRVRRPVFSRLNGENAMKEPWHTPIAFQCGQWIFKYLNLQRAALWRFRVQNPRMLTTTWYRIIDHP